MQVNFRYFDRRDTKGFNTELKINFSINDVSKALKQFSKVIASHQVHRKTLNNNNGWYAYAFNPSGNFNQSFLIIKHHLVGRVSSLLTVLSEKNNLIYETKIKKIIEKNVLTPINRIYDGENGTFDEFEAAFKYDHIIYGWNDAQKKDAIKICLAGKAKKLFEQMTDPDRVSIDTVFDKLKRGCVKSPEYYLNLFYSEKLKHEKKISTFSYRGQLGLDKENRTRILRSRLLSASSFPELKKGIVEEKKS
ncbi:hypothetical protein BpHYR1_003190 [Brachionus plicatilis]|uniref:Uncharacterized protein n=1 Tax=Brachionus plicatilis TaxID=10195 RepID=A0A3M7R077_BRAPC|nr:hypothetical protein BpHYR1_003190 [Brachionus plicatilis]